MILSAKVNRKHVKLKKRNKIKGGNKERKIKSLFCARFRLIERLKGGKRRNINKCNLIYVKYKINNLFYFRLSRGPTTRRQNKKHSNWTGSPPRTIVNEPNRNWIHL